jgi:hypothetical protein
VGFTPYVLERNFLVLSLLSLYENSRGVCSPFMLSRECTQSIKYTSDGKMKINNPGSHAAGINNTTASITPPTALM